MRVLLAAAVLVFMYVPLCAQTIKVRVLNIYHPESLEALQLNGVEKVKVRYVKGDNIEVIYNNEKKITNQYFLNSGRYGEYEIRLNGKSYIYKGKVMFFVPKDEKEAGIIVEMDPEDYVSASLDGELEGFYSSPESDKALAIAIRTYALKNLKRHGYYDLCDLTHCQRLNGRVQLKRDSNTKAAEATHGVIIADKKGNPADIYFSGCCGGETEPPGNIWGGNNDSAGVIKCGAGGGDFCKSHVFYRWEKEIKASSVKSLVKEKTGIHLKGNIDMSAEDLTPGGNVRMLLIKDKKNTVEFPLEKFISAYGKKYRWSDMPSRKFTVLKKGTSFILKGRGAGHGCGLCLAGAHMLALKGWSYEGVLNFYYPGMQLIKAPE